MYIYFAIISVIYLRASTIEAQEPCGDRSQYLCTNGECVSKRYLCDGSKECTDGSDETHDLCKFRSCSKSLDYASDFADMLQFQLPANAPKFRCHNGACISEFFLCDGIKHCVADGSDETKELCKNKKCKRNQFRCKYGACINRNKACDNRNYCFDGSDETPEACRWRRKRCLSTEFRCKYGSCIKKKLKCDGVPNCLDESDESKDTCDPTHHLVLNSSLPLPSNPLLNKEGDQTFPTTSSSTVQPPVVGMTNRTGCQQTDDHEINLEILTCGEESGCDGQIVPEGSLMLIYCDESPLPLLCKDDNLWHFERDPSKTPRINPCVDSGKPSGGSKTRPDARHILPTLPCGIHPPFSSIPWLVGLFRLGQFSCTGTIIGPSLVLTAGHCVLESQVSKTTTITRESLKIQFSDSKDFATVSSIVLHPHYSGGESPRNDMALLFLKENLEKEQGLSSACLDKKGSLFNVVAYTFNRTIDQSSYGWKSFKQAIDTSCFNLETECSRHINIGRNQFCAMNPNSTLYLHQGSSGGPYLITIKESGEDRWAVGGVVSNSIHTTECGTPHTVFTSVSKLYDWIFNCGFHGRCSD